MITNDIDLTINTGSKTVNNTHKWLKNNPNKLVNYKVNLKPLLDSTLLINTFEDLKRYYKNITIYYDYDIETKVELKDTNLPYVGFTKFSTTKNLIFQEHSPLNNWTFDSWSPNMQGDPKLRDGTGKADTYSWTDTNYILNGYKFTITDNGNIGDWDKKSENNKLLGFCIVDNKDFKWNFYLQATLGKIENVLYAYPNKRKICKKIYK